MRSISLKAAVIGGLVEFALTVLVAFLFSVALLLPRLGKLMESAATVGAEVGQSWTYQASAWVIGSISSVVGGYVAARIAGHDEIANGAASAWLSIAFNVWQWAFPPDTTALVYSITMIVAAPLLGAFGGYLKRGRKPLPV